ncbi:hypothetical protein X738_23230 [Mesorhizobium sp. LNHC209A00]|nr:hypothetical protein X738_23230 [Mesorhizobium sp. LNHC209A00]
MAPAILWPSQLYASSKKGISEHQPRRMLGVTNKIAWFMVHGIREAMAGDIKSSGPLGGEGKIVGRRNLASGAWTAITFTSAQGPGAIEAQDEAEARRYRSGRAWRQVRMVHGKPPRPLCAISWCAMRLHIDALHLTGERDCQFCLPWFESKRR